MATIALDKIAAATISATAPAGAPAASSARSARGGFWRRLWDAVIEAQELRAKTYVNGYLAHLTDGELAQHGMTRDQMIRRTRSLMTSL